jgi:GDP-4-dehydro-6-deoxy-D-mannose reductase
MKRSVLVTGAAGFTGRNLCSFLRTLPGDLDIVGIDLQGIAANMYNSFYDIDLLDAKQINNVIKEVRPHYIIHLAGVFGAEEAQQIFRVNVLSMASLLDAVKEHVPNAVFVAAGSAAEYGNIGQANLPVSEENPCLPVTPYGLSKYLATITSQYYYRVHGLCTMIVRPFQLVGKGVTSRLAPGAFAMRLTEAKKSGVNEIKVGNLESSRDFLDVRDAVRSIWMLCERPAPGEIFNLCSGNPVKIRDLLDLMISHIGTQIKPVMENDYLRGATDVNRVYGSYQKMHKHCGWKPIIPLQESIKSMFEEDSVTS